MTICLRPATRADAQDIAAFADVSSDGLISTLWARKTDLSQSPLEYGCAQVSQDEGSLSWRHATLAVDGDRVVGVVMTDQLAHHPAEITSETHPILRPLIRLENEARDTRTISALAVMPDVRRQGVARALLGAAEDGVGAAGMSVILADQNASALQFFARQGYETRATLPMVKADWETQSSAWNLLRKP